MYKDFITRKEIRMSEEFLSYSIVSAFIAAILALSNAYKVEQAEKKLKKIPIRIRRR